MRRQIVAVAVAALLSFTGRSALGEILYTVTDLGTLGGSNSYATGINNSGQVVGYADTSSGSTHAFLYSNGTMADLGTLSGASSSYGLGTNNNGQVVGYTYAANGSYRAFLYSNGTMADLGTLPGGSWSWATGINDNGQVVGWATPSSGTLTEHAFLYSNGKMADLGTLGGLQSQAYGINNNGQVVGAVTPSSGDAYAFLYSSSNGTVIYPGTLPGYSGSAALAINAGGQVAGFAWPPPTDPNSPEVAFLYSNGKMTALCDGDARGINDSGQVVGYGGNGHAFLYSNGTCADLNSLVSASSWTLEGALAINDSGQIVGDAYNHTTGQEQAVLLTPVPEPSTFALLGVGAISLVAYAWRRRRLAA